MLENLDFLSVEIGLGARGTQFIDSRRLFESLPQKKIKQLKELFAEHDFALRFPEIMGAKGVNKQHIMALRKKYPPSVHPLVQRTTFGDSLYFSELCVSRIHGVSEKESNDLINLLNSLLSETTEIYDHIWQPNDTLIWDNFSTIHRANPHATQGLRILHRSTAS